MVEYVRNTQRDSQSPAGLKTCIVGIGGAGGNVLDRITLDRSVDATLVAMHTDIRVLSHAMAPQKVQLGVELMRGVGAGGDPELGREAAMFSREQIRQAVEGHDIVFICAGLGGGTGSGAAPVIAEIAKATGALVFLNATMPFTFEGKRRLSQAEDALTQLHKRADALVLFENNRMGELILPKDGIQKAFSQADQLIAQSLRAISTIVTTPGLVKLGLDDLTAALSTSNGRCLFGFGEARGQNRGSEALKKALKSPLIDQGRLLHQTKTLLVHIAGGESLTLLEVDAIMKQLGKNVPDQTHILFGVAVDAKLGESVSVTLISSLGLSQLNTVAAVAPPVEMLPVSERAMPSVASLVGSPKPAIPAAPAPAPAPVAPPAPPPLNHLLDVPVSPRAPSALAQVLEAAAPAPAPVRVAPPAPKQAPLMEDAMDLLFADEEISRPAALLTQTPAPAPAPVVAPAPAPVAAAPIFAPAPEMFAPAPEPEPAPAPISVLARLPLAEPPPVMEAPEPEAHYEEEPHHEETPWVDEPEASAADHGDYEQFLPEEEEEAAAPAPAPVYQAPAAQMPQEEEAPPARPPRPRIEDFMSAPPVQRTTSLASVVSRQPTPVDEAPYAPPLNSVAAKKPLAPEEQIGLRFNSDEDRGRFKDTEPAMAGGEDLDVPTWMRLKRKLKK